MPIADLTLMGLTRTYGEQAVVSGIDLEVPQGALLSLLGPSGCGKTTLLRMIAGLLEPSSGDILFRGKSVKDVPVHKRGVGMLFQDYALFPHMTVESNVRFGLEMRMRDRRRHQALVLEALDMVQLAHLAERFPQELSGGQRQRVALARAIVTEPAFLLLDEPFGALDKNLRLEMQIQLREIQTKLKITTVMVTHDQEEALSISDLVAVMQGGRIAQRGTPAQIYTDPSSRFVASFIGASNLMRGRVAQREGDALVVHTESGLRVSAAVISAPPAIPAADQGEVTVMMRPESIRMEPVGGAGDDGLDRASGTVTRVVYRGAAIEFTVQLRSAHTLVCLQPSSPMQRAVGVGTQVSLRWDERSARIVWH
ncbi:polyamine ABC transporter, ATP-binding family protein [Paraburkholderia xenovorans LB400]|uniref:Spermidine/putrescine import ATP-binding protein PotA n=1 Tax=Paraburkholderia xenovorans (strain LB400) TaxID=266265 RepID=Q13FP5_PARXL|nr:ABC transporter ATP-binding protein [Paraburkholderia xenovorans]ABE37094.1 ABC spermidine/putrescine transporter, ATPase subunit [Paraburkholderia xenovorans LB400]AIP34748.1 polyamine ABC transporter, ATP-binding family protein [Paraburkholderia xenovorans LB400]